MTFNIKRLKNKKTVNITKLTEKRIVNSAKKHWKKTYTQFPHYFKKKLLLPDTQIIIAIMSDKSLYSSSVSVSFISVLFFAYYSNLTTLILFSVSLFKISLISTSVTMWSCDMRTDHWLELDKMTWQASL